MSLLSPVLGEFAETFHCSLRGSAAMLPLTIRGSIVGPRATLDVDTIDFGMASYGFRCAGHPTHIGPWAQCGHASATGPARGRLLPLPRLTVPSRHRPLTHPSLPPSGSLLPVRRARRCSRTLTLSNVSAIPMTYAWRHQTPGGQAAELHITPTAGSLQPGQQQELTLTWDPATVARMRQAFVMDIQV